MSKEYEQEKLPNPLQVECSDLSVLSEADRQNIFAFVTYDGTFPTVNILYLEGRNIIIRQQQAIGGFDAIQISGAGFHDMGILDNEKSIAVISQTGNTISVEPPRKHSKIFTHITTIVSDGKPIELIEQSPLGSYTERNAAAKFRNTQKAFHLAYKAELPFYVPLPIGFIHYKDIPDEENGRQTALIFSCPIDGLRASAMVNNIYKNAQAILPGEERDRYITDKFQYGLFPLLKLMGKAAAFLHASNFCHYQMTLGNVPPVYFEEERPTFCLYDWATLTHVDVTNPELARAYDMSVSIVSISELLSFYCTTIGLFKQAAINIGYNGLLHYLNGYSNGDILEIHKTLGLTAEEMYFASTRSAKSIVHSMQNIILPRLGL